MDSAFILFFLEVMTVSVLGLVLGSFCTAVTYREAQNQPWYVLSKKDGQRWSFCPHCKHRLHMCDLIPLLSWALTKGRCRYCSTSVSIRYPITELISLMLCLGIYVVFGLNTGALLLMFMAPFLIALIFIDLDRLILPNRLVVIFGVFAVLYMILNFAQHGFRGAFILDHAVGAVTYPAIFGLSAFIMGKMLGKSAIGMGDIKALFPVGFILGGGVLSPFLIFSGFLGVLTAVLVKKYKKSDVFPFGPALIIAFYVVFLCKEAGIL